MNRIRIIFFLSIAALITGGIMFANASRYGKAVGVIGSLRDKTIVFYSSNNKKAYLKTGESGVNDMENLCIQGASSLREGSLDSVYLKIPDGNEYPFTRSGMYLKSTLKDNREYILVDISRDQTRYGGRYKTGKSISCPISIVLSKESPNHDDSLLFAGRIKAIIDSKFNTLPVKIISVDSEEYNQGQGCMGMLLLLGDSENTFSDASSALKVFCDAVKEIAEKER